MLQSTLDIRDSDKRDFHLQGTMQKVLRVLDRTLRQSVIREFGNKRLIKLVPADLLYPKLTVQTKS